MRSQSITDSKMAAGWSPAHLPFAGWPTPDRRSRIGQPQRALDAVGSWVIDITAPDSNLA
ncbi:MAG: hypothetical protein OXC00_08895 [Acidimicrobiaceae bacterium]|nr:hypothetical protein [Acidimicrobiaceae bacterium]